jgi:hypothetical protein
MLAKLSQNSVQDDLKVTTCETISKNYALCKQYFFLESFQMHILYSSRSW